MTTVLRYTSESDWSVRARPATISTPSGHQFQGSQSNFISKGDSYEIWSSKDALYLAEAGAGGLTPPATYGDFRFNCKETLRSPVLFSREIH